jgi:hypothetical protein
MEKMELNRLKDQDDGLMIMNERNLQDDTTPWLLRTHWPQMFRDKDLIIIGRSRYPELVPPVKDMFKRWKGKRIQILTWGFEKALARAKESLAVTSTVMCCWLRSVKRMEPDPRPFKLVQKEATERRYTQLWKHFLYYCFRMGELDVDTRKRLFGVEFTGEQIRCMVQVEEIIDGMMAEYHEESLSCESGSENDDDEDDDLYEDDSEDEDESDKENSEDVQSKRWREGTI